MSTKQQEIAEKLKFKSVRRGKVVDVGKASGGVGGDILSTKSWKANELIETLDATIKSMPTVTKKYNTLKFSIAGTVVNLINLASKTKP